MLARNLVKIARVTGKRAIGPGGEAGAGVGVLRGIGVEFAVGPAVGNPRAFESPHKRARHA